MPRGLNDALDEYLVLLAQSGSGEALGRLVARWRPRLMAFAARTIGTEAAHDVVQETWEGAIRALPRLEDPARFRGWLYGIAARKCADALRGKYRNARLVTAAADVAPASDAIAPDERLDLGAALKALPAEQRLVVGLYFGEGLSVGEIASALALPPGTVKSRLFAARKALRAHMEGEKS